LSNTPPPPPFLRSLPPRMEVREDLAYEVHILSCCSYIRQVHPLDQPLNNMLIVSWNHVSIHQFVRIHFNVAICISEGKLLLEE
jgi:hypothetical protein